jgi:hypothetical protein
MLGVTTICLTKSGESWLCLEDLGEFRGFKAIISVPIYACTVVITSLVSSFLPPPSVFTYV